MREAIGEVREAHDIEHLGDTRPALAARHAPHPEPELDVPGDGQVREQRVLLEHHADVAAVHGDTRDVLAADPDPARGDGLEPRDAAERGRLPAAGGAEQTDELTRFKLQVNAVQHRRLAV